jgi:predicted phosphate transport protein (TIGR00153 family)
MARLSLVPKDREFFNLFDEAGANILHSAQLLDRLMKQWPDAGGLGREILICEQEGDRITHDIIHRLNSTSVTPIDREDIYALASALDDVLDAIEAAGDLFVLHSIEAPRPSMIEQADVLVRAARQTESAIKTLGRFDRPVLEPYWIEINSLENEGDRLYRRAVADMFGGDHRAMDVLRWKEVSETLEEALDGLENVANIVEAVVLKHA